ncbi:MAG: glycosyltransferase family 2 protein [Patescibacteria group bacterium]|nr:glycosyltransferase family 2 protein [Patescibacteria group bacterium]
MITVPIWVSVVIIICISLQAERGIFDLISFNRLFGQLRKRSIVSTNFPRQTIYILIPVLREQDIIEEAVIRFCKLAHDKLTFKIVLITTEKETVEAGGQRKTTEEYVADSIASGKLTDFKDRILIIRDPNTHGNMATQLNYAIRKLSDTAPMNSFYLVYNADSIITRSTLEKLAELLSRHEGMEFAFQQPCAFVKDMGPDSNKFTNAMSLYQSWYCLGHESRLIRNYDARSERWWRKRNGKLGVVVGHGSGMTIGINRNNGGYPSDLLTEDLTFGFILSTKNVPILSLPALEIADVPSRFSVFIKQKSVWFWNFLGYGSCYRKMSERGFSKPKIISLLIQGIGAGAYWALDTFFVLIPLILSLYLSSYIGICIAVLSFLTFYTLPQYILFKRLPGALEHQGFTEHAKNIRKLSFLTIFPTISIISLTNSVGPWIATVKGIKYLFTGKLPIKYKTGD